MKIPSIRNGKVFLCTETPPLGGLSVRMRNSNGFLRFLCPSNCISSTLEISRLRTALIHVCMDVAVCKGLGLDIHIDATKIPVRTCGRIYDSFVWIHVPPDGNERVCVCVSHKSRSTTCFQPCDHSSNGNILPFGFRPRGNSYETCLTQDRFR